jgi:heme exporter protein D
MAAMTMLIWLGAALTVVGIIMLGWCIVLTVRARKSGLDDTALRARLQRLVALNFGALAVSAMGLMMVIVGILLG